MQIHVRAISIWRWSLTLLRIFSLKRWYFLSYIYNENPCRYVETESHGLLIDTGSWWLASLTPVNTGMYVNSSPASAAYIEGILPKGPNLPCVSMVGRALLAGYPRYASVNWVGIGSDNGLSPILRQAIIRTIAGLLSTEPLGTNFCEFFFYQNTKLFFHETASEYIVSETAAVSSRGRSVKSPVNSKALRAPMVLYHHVPREVIFLTWEQGIYCGVQRHPSKRSGHHWQRCGYPSQDGRHGIHQHPVHPG